MPSARHSVSARMKNASSIFRRQGLKSIKERLKSGLFRGCSSQTRPASPRPPTPPPKPAPKSKQPSPKARSKALPRLPPLSAVPHQPQPQSQSQSQPEIQPQLQAQMQPRTIMPAMETTSPDVHGARDSQTTTEVKPPDNAEVSTGKKTTERGIVVVTLPPQLSSDAYRDGDIMIEERKPSDEPAGTAQTPTPKDENRMFIHNIASERNRAKRRERILLAVSKLYGLAVIVASALEIHAKESSSILDFHIMRVEENLMLTPMSQLLTIAEELFLVLSAHMDLAQQEVNAYNEFPCIKNTYCGRTWVILPACVEILMSEEIFGVLDLEIKTLKWSRHTRQKSSLGSIPVLDRFPQQAMRKKIITATTDHKSPIHQVAHGINPIYRYPPAMVLALVSEMNRSTQLRGADDPLDWASLNRRVDKNGQQRRQRQRRTRSQNLRDCRSFVRDALYNREAGEAALKGMKIGEYRRTQGQWPLAQYLQDRVCVCPRDCPWCDQSPQLPDFADGAPFPWNNGAEKWNWDMFDEMFRGCSVNGGDWLCPCSSTMKTVVSFREQHCRDELHSKCTSEARRTLTMAVVAHEKAKRPMDGGDYYYRVEAITAAGENAGATEATKRIIKDALTGFHEQVVRYRKLDGDPGHVLFDPGLDLPLQRRARVSVQSLSSVGSTYTEDEEEDDEEEEEEEDNDDSNDDYIPSSPEGRCPSSLLEHSPGNSSQTNPSSLFFQRTFSHESASSSHHFAQREMPSIPQY